MGKGEERKAKRGRAEKVKGGKENGKGGDWEAGGKQNGKRKRKA